MASEVISALPTGVPKGTDLTPATDPTNTSSAPTGTTNKYVRSDELNFYLMAQGLTTYQATRVATIANLSATYANGSSGIGATLTNSGAQAAIAIDGVTLALNDRVLIKNQSTTYENGIYYVSNLGSASTNWILTRSLDYNQPIQVIQYGVILSNQGVTNAGLLWQETGAGPFTIGTTAIIFAQYTTQSISVPVTLAEGGTSAVLTASDGGIFYSTATAGAILAGTATLNQVLLSGSSTAPAWSTAIYPSTTTVNQLLYSGTANQISGLATANSSTLITSSGGVPSFSQTLPSTVQGNITTLGTIGTGVWNGTTIGVSYGGTGVTAVTITPTATSFAGWDTNSNLSANNVLSAYTTTATAASSTALTIASTYLQYWTGSTTQTVTLPHLTTPLGASFYFVNNSTGAVTVEASGGQSVQVMASGSSCLFTCISANGTTAASWNAQYFIDSDVSGAVLLSPAGTQTISNHGLVLPSINFSSTTGIIGTTTNNSAAAGSVGEIISNTVLAGSAVSLSTSMAADVTSIALTAGDWDVYGNVTAVASIALQTYYSWVSLTSATAPDLALRSGRSPTTSDTVVMGMPTPYIQISVATTTTVYLSVATTFGSGSCAASGSIFARRAR